MKDLKSRCAGDPLPTYYDAVAVLKLQGWTGEPENLIQEGRKLEQQGGACGDRSRLDPLLESLLAYLTPEDQLKLQGLLGRTIKSSATLPGAP